MKWQADREKLTAALRAMWFIPNLHPHRFRVAGLFLFDRLLVTRFPVGGGAGNEGPDFWDALPECIRKVVDK